MDHKDLKVWNDTHCVAFNPHNKPVEDLPTIWCFNNGGSPGFFDAVALAENGDVLGGHLCSHEGFIPGDLGAHVGHRLDRHENQYSKCYPDGYKMHFIPSSELENHQGINDACKKHQEKYGEKSDQ